jgi:energy-converting hydrogenase A subunit M
VPEGLLVLTDKLNVFRRNKALEDLVHQYAEKLNYSEEELADIITEEVKMRVISGEKSDIRIPRRQR